MTSRAASPIERGLILVTAIAAASLMVPAALRHARAERWAGTQDADLWLRAAELESSNPENWYRLGRYRQLDFEHSDLSMAIDYYRRAISLNPRAARYWMDLSSAYETQGDMSQAEQALRTAEQDYPNSGEVAWRFGNFLLRQNRVDEAFAQIHHAVVEDPNLTALAVSRCWRSTQDIQRILDTVIPANTDAYWGALEFLTGAKEPDAAVEVWKRLISSQQSFELSRSFPLFEMLVEAGRPEDAATVWQQAVKQSATPTPPEAANNQIWNGGFEGDLINGGLSWRYRPQAGADINWDEETRHSGSRSLRIDFDGTANVDFQEFWQYVAVQPDTHYRFAAYARSEDLTTEKGVGFEVDDVTATANREQLHRMAPQVTNEVSGTEPWTLLKTEFTTASDTHLLRVILRRSPSSMLVNKIKGTAWVDDVSLTAAPGDSAERE